MEGILSSIIAGEYKVFCDGAFFSCTVKKSLKNSKKILVGSKVTFDESKMLITEIEEPKNSLIRPNVCNVDLAVVVSSIVEPLFSTYLILKFVTYFLYQRITPIVVFTKTDLANAKNIEDLQGFLKNLEKANIKYFVLNKFENEKIQALKDFLKGKTCLFAGQSGVGKSSLINAIEPNFNRLIGEYSRYLNRGKHQTKENIILPLNDDTFLVDTPGFSSLDLNMDKISIRDNFPIISDFLNQCKYDNCLHLSEPNCKIKELVDSGEISKDWYNDYTELINNEEL